MKKTPKWMLSRMARKAKTTQFKSKSYGTNRGRARRRAPLLDIAAQSAQALDMAIANGAAGGRQTGKRINTRSSVRK